MAKKKPANRVEKTEKPHVKASNDREMSKPLDCGSIPPSFRLQSSDPEMRKYLNMTQFELIGEIHRMNSLVRRSEKDHSVLTENIEKAKKTLDLQCDKLNNEVALRRKLELAFTEAGDELEHIAMMICSGKKISQRKRMAICILIGHTLSVLGGRCDEPEFGDSAPAESDPNPSQLPY